MLDELHVLRELPDVVVHGTFALEDLHRHGDFVVDVGEWSEP